MSAIQAGEAKRVCHSCIGDQFLADEVKRQGTPVICSYCSETREAITLEILADRIRDALQEHFDVTPDQPDDGYEYFLYRQGEWERRGDPVEYVISEMGGLDIDVASDVTALLSEWHGYRATKDGDGEDPYGSDAMYENRDPNDSDFRYSWAEFRREVRSRSRFFSAKSEAMLCFVLGDLNSYIAENGSPVVREINPGDKDASVWRARTAQSTKELEAILKSPSREMSPPPSMLAKAARMNPQGIPVFYGAMDKFTCVSEVRPPVGSRVVVGRFGLLQAIRLLDLDMLATVHARGSLFDPNYSEQEGRAEFFRHLVSDISRPVMPQDEALEYLSTQVVAEYLAHKVNPRVDGVIFRSSQTAGEGRNLVLFNHARRVESYDLPIGTDLRVNIPHSDEDGDYGAISVFETVPPDSPEEEAQTGTDGRQRRSIRLFEDDELEDVERFSKPILRLDVESVEVLDIECVTYASSSHVVTRHRQTEEERDAPGQRILDVDVDRILDVGV